MGRHAALLVVVAAGGLAGCGPKAAPLADGCTDRAAVAKALRGAPQDVALPDGSSLASCIADGTDDGDLQNVGLTYSGVEEQLVPAAATDPTAALQLGYLVGATRKGAERTQGVMAELQNRLEQRAGRALDGAPEAEQRQLDRGVAAGEARG